MYPVAITLRPLMGEIRNIDSLVTEALSIAWDILGSKCSVLEIDVLKAEKMGRYNDFSYFDKCHIVLAAELGHSTSASRFSHSAVVRALLKVVQRRKMQ